MPAKSEKQRRYMAMCNKTMKKGCPPKSVSKKFMRKKRG
jgi:hypothetical protein